MIAELDIYGVFVPALLAWMLLAFVVYLLARRALSWSGFYTLVWHRPLFDTALYILLVGAVVLVALRFLR